MSDGVWHSEMIINSLFVFPSKVIMQHAPSVGQLADSASLGAWPVGHQLGASVVGPNQRKNMVCLWSLLTQKYVLSYCVTRRIWKCCGNSLWYLVVAESFWWKLSHHIFPNMLIFFTFCTSSVGAGWYLFFNHLVSSDSISTCIL